MRAQTEHIPLRKGDRVSFTGSPTAHVVDSQKKYFVFTRCDKKMMQGYFTLSSDDAGLCEKCRGVK